MALPEPEATQEREPLNRERVLHAAIQLADTAGLKGLSMRKLAQELGVEAMSLYHYVPSKAALLDACLDAILAAVQLPRIAGAWQAELRASAQSAHAVLLRHPWACGLLTTVAPDRIGPQRLAWMEAVLHCLRSAGFSALQSHHAYHALDSHIAGFTLWASGFVGQEEALVAGSAMLTQRLAAGNYPYLVEHLELHFSGAADADVGTFEFTLELLLAGFARLLE